VLCATTRQSQSTEAHADQSQRERDDRPGSSATGAETAGEGSQMHHTQDQRKQRQDQCEYRPRSSVAGAGTTGASQSKPTGDEAD
jgi:hypothetical protein